MNLPVPDLRSNRATWAVPTHSLPAVAVVLRSLYPTEEYDPAFVGQCLATTYFDTEDFTLRKARVKGNQYLTLRIRRYLSMEGGEVFALSAKTESQKTRIVVDADDARAVLAGAYLTLWHDRLPGDLIARLIDLAGDQPLLPVITVRCRRYAVQDDRDRLTLDVDVATNASKRLSYHVLEFKSTQKTTSLPDALQPLGMPFIKLSKFLWATQP